MLRWRIERDDQELKEGVGLGHFEGRGWRGFHHHATLCVAAYGFLISERETIPPSGDRATTRFPQFALREGTQPRESPVAASTPRSELDCNDATEIGGRARHDALALPMLRRSEPDTKVCDTVRLEGCCYTVPGAWNCAGMEELGSIRQS